MVFIRKYGATPVPLTSNKNIEINSAYRNTNPNSNKLQIKGASRKDLPGQREGSQPKVDKVKQPV